MLADNRDAFDAALAERLVRGGKLEAQALERAARIRGEGAGLIEILPKLGLVAEREVAAAAAEILDLPLLAPRDYPAAPLLDGKVSCRFLRARRLLPVAEDERGLAVAMADPLDRQALDAIGLAAGMPVRACVGVPAELEAALERLYGDGRMAGSSLDGANGGFEGGLERTNGHAAGDPSAELDIERLKDLASEAPVIRYVNQLIADAAERRASDIHIEPFEGRLRIRFRIDGALREIEPPPARLRTAILSRIKIMARLNIAERRLPQDGRIDIAIRGVPIDLRVATMPTLHGEAAVLRLLDRRNVALDFEALGMAGSLVITA
ncbi:MAG: GspE/PulE family protein [Pseudomonadota bacterium]